MKPSRYFNADKGGAGSAGNLSPVDELMKLRNENAALKSGQAKAPAAAPTPAPAHGAPLNPSAAIALPASVDQARDIYARYTALDGRAQAVFWEANAAALQRSGDMIAHAEATDAAPEALPADMAALHAQHEALMKDGRAREAAAFWDKHQAAFAAAIR